MRVDIFWRTTRFLEAIQPTSEAVESAQNDHASMVHSVLKNKQAMTCLFYIWWLTCYVLLPWCINLW